jgi:hypothetical protein
MAGGQGLAGGRGSQGKMMPTSSALCRLAAGFPASRWCFSSSSDERYSRVLCYAHVHGQPALPSVRHTHHGTNDPRSIGGFSPTAVFACIMRMQLIFTIVSTWASSPGDNPRGSARASPGKYVLCGPYSNAILVTLNRDAGHSDRREYSQKSCLISWPLPIHESRTASLAIVNLFIFLVPLPLSASNYQESGSSNSEAWA